MVKNRSDKPVTDKTLASTIKKLEERLDKKLDKRVAEILDHFDAVAENIHRDVAGANVMKSHWRMTK